MIFEISLPSKPTRRVHHYSRWKHLTGISIGEKFLRPCRRLAVDLKSVIEEEIQAEVKKAQGCPDQLENHIRTAFMNGMVLGARLQTKLPDATTSRDGWCEVRERE
jgi:hypothetical protein